MNRDLMTNNPLLIVSAIFVFFILLLGAFTLKTAAPEVSFVGKVSGGLFVWAMAMIDAYKTARIRRAVWDHRQV